VKLWHLERQKASTPGSPRGGVGGERGISLARLPHRVGLGAALAGVGAGVWALGGFHVLGLATATPAGAFMAAVGASFLWPPPARGWLRRRTSLVVIVPALLLFGIVLLGAAVAFADRFDRATNALTWIGSALILLLAAAMVSGLFREVVLRAEVRRAGRGEDRPSAWHFTPRWRDDLVCSSQEGRVVLGMAADEVHVPTEEAWARRAPAWATGRRSELLTALEAWSVAYGVRLTVSERAVVEAG
jgi:hypothetical protein